MYDIHAHISSVFVISKVWEKAEEFLPERFDIEGAIPNETNTDFK